MKNAHGATQKALPNVSISSLPIPCEAERGMPGMNRLAGFLSPRRESWLNLEM